MLKVVSKNWLSSKSLQNTLTQLFTTTFGLFDVLCNAQFIKPRTTDGMTASMRCQNTTKSAEGTRASARV